MIKLLDLIIESKLFEMALSRQHALQKIDRLNYQISNHLLKLIVFNDSNAFNHWLKEVNTWLFEIDEIHLKPKYKKLPLRDYTTYLKEPYLEHPIAIEKMVKRLKQDYKEEKIVNGSVNSIYEVVDDIMTKVCKQLAEDVFEPLTEEDFNYE